MKISVQLEILKAFYILLNYEPDILETFQSYTKQLGEFHFSWRHTSKDVVRSMAEQNISTITCDC